MERGKLDGFEQLKCLVGGDFGGARPTIGGVGWGVGFVFFPNWCENGAKMDLDG